MRILVTGAAGFIGSHLGRELRAHGYEVVERDLQDGDLSHPGVFAAALEDSKAEQVIHLAAQVGRAFGEDDLVHTVTSNATMTTLIAHACGQAGVPVLYASTSEVYGDQRGEICRESTRCVEPKNLYGLSKRWGEEALFLYAPEGLQRVRLSMPYGPGAPPGRGRRALDNILWQALHGKPIPIHRGAVRSWCWVGDCVAGIRMVMESGERSDAYGYPSKGVFNIGRDDDPLTMEDLAKRCCKLVGASEDLIELMEPPAAQTVVKNLSMEKLERLGWKPTVDLDEGLPLVEDWIANFDADGHWQAAA